ncbi:MAG: lipid-A-disaccharide synthase-related protein [candidate division WOR-3 bacterium]|nr:lipid-A-disaccharide synthase-related protein [candidate division WOR-3 bacterium]
MKIAFLSNSYGEDRSGALIGQKIKNLHPKIKIIAFPLISFGEEYQKRGIDVIGGSTPPPSGGFLLKSLAKLGKDIIETFPAPFSYIKRVHEFKDEIDLAIVVGDVPLLIMGWIALRRREYFLAPCKSDWIAPHLKVEKIIMQRLTEVVFTHDELTASNLREKGVNALFLGNPMMDGLNRENKYHPPEGSTLIGILPGSREESYGNMKKISKVVEILSSQDKNLNFAVALSETVDKERMMKSLDGVNSEIELVEGGFIDILKKSKLVISLAGTASEQAVGLGIPVVSFSGSGAQTTKRRLLGQKKLLGEAFTYLEYEPKRIAKKIQEILDGKELKNLMKRNGIKRMGPPGGAKRIAEFILEKEGI